MAEGIVNCDDCALEFSLEECQFADGGDNLCRDCHDNRGTAPHELAGCDWCQQDADNGELG